MCGRYTLSHSPESIAQSFHLTQIPPLEPHYNIAPGQPVLVVRSPDDEAVSSSSAPAARESTFLLWGLVPSWAKDPKLGSRMINARAETVAEKPSFRAAFKRRRCLIVADGFYEWHRLPQGKQPYYFHLEEHQPFAFAGLWEHWENGMGDVIESCTILTTEANEILHPIHDRMPVILSPEDYPLWLDSSVQGGDRLHRCLRPYPATAMQRHPVSSKINSPRYNSPLCIEPDSNSA